MVAALSLSGLIAYSQEALWEKNEIISPEIHENKSVAFRLSAPNAGEVMITGDWMPVEGLVPGTEAMEKDDNGIWSFTTEALEPELYSYAFLVDGMRINDPNNAFLSRDISTNTNIFLIEGPPADLLKVNDVAHGSVVRRWYNSPGLEMNRRITIYTPPGYESSQEQYPVL